MTDSVAKKMSQASGTMERHMPKKGERYRCTQCGMEIQVNRDCGCKNDDQLHFQCCGQELSKM